MMAGISAIALTHIFALRSPARSFIPDSRHFIPPCLHFMPFYPIRVRVLFIVVLSEFP